ILTGCGTGSFSSTTTGATSTAKTTCQSSALIRSLSITNSDFSLDLQTKGLFSSVQGPLSCLTNNSDILFLNNSAGGQNNGEMQQLCEEASQLMMPTGAVNGGSQSQLFSMPSTTSSNLLLSTGGTIFNSMQEQPLLTSNMPGSSSSSVSMSGLSTQGTALAGTTLGIAPSVAMSTMPPPLSTTTSAVSLPPPSINMMGPTTSSTNNNNSLLAATSSTTHNNGISSTNDLLAPTTSTSAQLMGATNFSDLARSFSVTSTAMGTCMSQLDHLFATPTLSQHQQSTPQLVNSACKGTGSSSTLGGPPPQQMQNLQMPTTGSATLGGPQNQQQFGGVTPQGAGGANGFNSGIGRSGAAVVPSTGVDLTRSSGIVTVAPFTDQRSRMAFPTNHRSSGTTSQMAFPTRESSTTCQMVFPPQQQSNSAISAGQNSLSCSSNVTSSYGIQPQGSNPTSIQGSNPTSSISHSGPQPQGSNPTSMSSSTSMGPHGQGLPSTSAKSSSTAAQPSNRFAELGINVPPPAGRSAALSSESTLALQQLGTFASNNSGVLPPEILNPFVQAAQADGLPKGRIARGKHSTRGGGGAFALGKGAKTSCSKNGPRGTFSEYFGGKVGKDSNTGKFRYDEVGKGMVTSSDSYSESTYTFGATSFTWKQDKKKSSYFHDGYNHSYFHDGNAKT
ncbi:unnamed protein product, partial [Amoebophrya sp. A25]